LRRSRRNAYRRAPTGPVEDLPSHLTTDAHVHLDSLVLPRMQTSQSKNSLSFQCFVSVFFLEDPKLRSDLCGSWMRASPASAFLHLHMALHLAHGSPGNGSGFAAEASELFRTVRIRGNTSKHGVLEGPALLEVISRRSVKQDGVHEHRGDQLAFTMPDTGPTTSRQGAHWLRWTRLGKGEWRAAEAHASDDEEHRTV
jgi:hypothetical protein